MVLVTPCTYESMCSAMKLIKRQQLIQVLMGLNEVYQMVRSNILMLNTLPSVTYAYTMVIQEEQQREIKTFHQAEFGTSAFLSQQRMQSTQQKFNSLPPHYPPQNVSYNFPYGTQ